MKKHENGIADLSDQYNNKRMNDDDECQPQGIRHKTIGDQPTVDQARLG